MFQILQPHQQTLWLEKGFMDLELMKFRPELRKIMGKSAKYLQPMKRMLFRQDMSMQDLR